MTRSDSTPRLLCLGELLVDMVPERAKARADQFGEEFQRAQDVGIVEFGRAGIDRAQRAEELAAGITI